MNILFVCTANVSRSFFADKFLTNEIKRLDLDNVFISSAGVSVFHGMSPDPKMVEYLLKLEISVEQHEPRQITREDVDWADHILVMERDHAKRIESFWPDVKDKVELLGKYIAQDQHDDDIADPYGMLAYHYRLAQSQITMAIRTFIQEVILQS